MELALSAFAAAAFFAVILSASSCAACSKSAVSAKSGLQKKALYILPPPTLYIYVAVWRIFCISLSDIYFNLTRSIGVWRMAMPPGFLMRAQRRLAGTAAPYIKSNIKLGGEKSTAKYKNKVVKE